MRAGMARLITLLLLPILVYAAIPLKPPEPSAIGTVNGPIQSREPGGNLTSVQEDPVSGDQSSVLPSTLGKDLSQEGHVLVKRAGFLSRVFGGKKKTKSKEKKKSKEAPKKTDSFSKKRKGGESKPKKTGFVSFKKVKGGRSKPPVSHMPKSRVKKPEPSDDYDSFESDAFEDEDEKQGRSKPPVSHMPKSRVKKPEPSDDYDSFESDAFEDEDEKQEDDSYDRGIDQEEDEEQEEDSYDRGIDQEEDEEQEDDSYDRGIDQDEDEEQDQEYEDDDDGRAQFDQDDDDYDGDYQDRERRFFTKHIKKIFKPKESSSPVESGQQGRLERKNAMKRKPVEDKPSDEGDPKYRPPVNQNDEEDEGDYIDDDGERQQNDAKEKGYSVGEDLSVDDYEDEADDSYEDEDNYPFEDEGNVDDKPKRFSLRAQQDEYSSEEDFYEDE